ncbi:MAG: hypothetical protein MMC23_007678 [Stictis urceolatum]|nr:hypothetical protein [Stictis urceolata]
MFFSISVLLLFLFGGIFLQPVLTYSQLLDTALCVPNPGPEHFQSVSIGINFFYKTVNNPDAIDSNDNFNQVWLLDQNCTVISKKTSISAVGSETSFFKDDRINSTLLVDIETRPGNPLNPKPNPGVLMFSWPPSAVKVSPIWNGIKYNPYGKLDQSLCTCKTAARNPKDWKTCGGGDFCCGCKWKSYGHVIKAVGLSDVQGQVTPSLSMGGGETALSPQTTIDVTRTESANTFTPLTTIDVTRTESANTFTPLTTVETSAPEPTTTTRG